MLSSWIFPSVFLSARLIKTDVVPLSAFLMFISVLFFKSLSALRSAGGRLFLGFEICTSNFPPYSFILNGHKDPGNEVRDFKGKGK